MSDKTLVERLRDLQNDDCACITQCDFVNAVGAKCCREMQGYGCNLCFNVTIKAIIDAIEREHLPRPKTEVLDADGVPIRIGDTLWGVNTGRSLVVDGLGERWFCATGDTVKHNPLAFSHKEPDSLERIEEDAKKITWDYWRCPRIDCCNCPVKTDGKNPRERYNTSRCHTAMTLDLLRRQREVLERGSNG